MVAQCEQQMWFTAKEKVTNARMMVVKEALVDACVAQLRARAEFMEHQSVGFTHTPPVLYIDTWFADDSVWLSKVVTVAALLSLLRGIGEPKARQIAQAIWQINLKRGAQYGVLVNSEPGVALLHELCSVSWPPRYHDSFGLLDDTLSTNCSLLRVRIDLHFNQSPPSALTLATIRSLADVSQRRSQFTLAVNCRSDWDVPLQDLIQLEAIAAAGGVVEAIPALRIRPGTQLLVKRALQTILSSGAHEVDVNCGDAHNETFPAVLSAVGPAAETVRLCGDGEPLVWKWIAVMLFSRFAQHSLQSLSMDLRPFSPAALEVVKAVTQLGTPCAALLGAEPQHVKWLRAPSLHDRPFPAVIRGDYKNEPIVALLPCVGITQVVWSEEFEVLEWETIPSRASNPTISSIDITSMTQESATSVAGLLRLIGGETEHLSVRHSAFTARDADTALYKWWKKVFRWCPWVETVSYIDVAMPQAMLLVRAASIEGHALRKLQLTVYDATGLSDFLSVISRDRHWKSTLEILVIRLKTNSMQRCTRLHNCAEQNAERPPRSRYDDDEIDRIHTENAAALESLFTSFSSEHPLWNIHVDMEHNVTCADGFDDLIEELNPLEATQMPVIWRGGLASKRAFMGLLSVVVHPWHEWPSSRRRRR